MWCFGRKWQTTYSHVLRTTRPWTCGCGSVGVEQENYLVKVSETVWGSNNSSLTSEVTLDISSSSSTTVITITFARGCCLPTGINIDCVFQKTGSKVQREEDVLMYIISCMKLLTIQVIRGEEKCVFDLGGTVLWIYTSQRFFNMLFWSRSALKNKTFLLSGKFARKQWDLGLMSPSAQLWLLQLTYWTTVLADLQVSLNTPFSHWYLSQLFFFFFCPQKKFSNPFMSPQRLLKM